MVITISVSIYKWLSYKMSRHQLYGFVVPSDFLIFLYQMSKHIFLFMSMGWDDVSELRPQTGLLFIPQVIYENGEPRWNDIDRVKAKNSDKNMSQCHLVNHKSHMEWLGREIGPSLRSPATNRLSYERATADIKRWIKICVLRTWECRSV
jgi:hypothetical protein